MGKVKMLNCVYVPIARVYPSILLVNHIRGTVFKLLYIHISNDSPYFRCPEHENFSYFVLQYLLLINSIFLDDCKVSLEDPKLS